MLNCLSSVMGLPVLGAVSLMGVIKQVRPDMPHCTWYSRLLKQVVDCLCIHHTSTAQLMTLVTLLRGNHDSATMTHLIETAIKGEHYPRLIIIICICCADNYPSSQSWKLPMIKCSPLSVCWTASSEDLVTISGCWTDVLKKYKSDMTGPFLLAVAPSATPTAWSWQHMRACVTCTMSMPATELMSWSRCKLTWSRGVSFLTASLKMRQWTADHFSNGSFQSHTCCKRYKSISVFLELFYVIFMHIKDNKNPQSPANMHSF